MTLTLRRLRWIVSTHVSNNFRLYFSVVMSFILLNIFFWPYSPLKFIFHPRRQYFYPTEIDPDYQWIPECNCSRRNFYFRDLQQTVDEGTFFEYDQKVISYTLYLRNEKDVKVKEFYIHGIAENLQAMRILYPGYTMRVYTSTSKEQGFCFLLCNNSDLFWCHIRNTPSHGDQLYVYFMIWRFLPLGDDTVDIFLSRDLDSIVTEREAAAVQDWLQLSVNYAFHVMRDKKDAHDYPILGGLWGARNRFIKMDENKEPKQLLSAILKRGFWKPQYFQFGKGFDQKVLTEILFLPKFNQIVAYDSYHCESSLSMLTLVRPFPTRRKNNESDFVGNSGFGKDKYELEKCPLGCRPSYGEDWEYC